MDNEMKNANTEINQLLETGLAMEAFEKFYAQDVIMQENDSEPRVGKDLNREQCGGFVAAHTDLKLKVLSTAYGNNLSFQEVLFNYTAETGEAVEYTEVAVRHWKNGEVIREKFYYGT